MYKKWSITMATECEIELAGSKKIPYFVITVHDVYRSYQVDMMFDEYSKAEKYAKNKGWVISNDKPNSRPEVSV
jgi:hypothetical protein